MIVNPVANGLRTDHPVPGVPFVDDSHIPVEDRRAVELVGRHQGEGMWGRADPCRDGGWVAFTTDPRRRDLAWLVRWHPEHGRSVLVFRDEDISVMHMEFQRPSALLFRSGGYWWDGQTWFRPPQVWDRAAERYLRRAVPAAASVSAADLLQRTIPLGKQAPLGIEDLDLDAPMPKRWIENLTLWASHRSSEDRPLDQCVVQLTAPELNGDQLVGATEMAEIAGIGASTMRAYLTRGEGEVPLPQAMINGRSLWARPVAEEWAEKRRDSADGTAEALMTQVEGSAMSPGRAETWNWFTRLFFSRLWEDTRMRQRWALRWRTKDKVRRVSRELGWDAAVNMDRFLPRTGDLALVLQQAVLYDLVEQGHLYRSFKGAQEDATVGPVEDTGLYGISHWTERVLAWFVLHHPISAHDLMAEIVGTAEGTLGIPRETTVHTLKVALNLREHIDATTRHEFIAHALEPLLKTSD
jgi:hypothetical protein